MNHLSALTDLEFLNLQQNGIESIEGLGGLTMMKTLILSHNKITGISSLLNLAELEELNLQSNTLYANDGTGIDGLISANGELALPKLRKLDIWDNTNWNGFLGNGSNANTAQLCDAFQTNNRELGFSYDRIQGFNTSGLPHTDANGVAYVTYDDVGVRRHRENPQSAQGESKCERAGRHDRTAA